MRETRAEREPRVSVAPKTAQTSATQATSRAESISQREILSPLVQILHEGRVFCRAAPLGTPENNRRLHIVQKITKNLTTLHNSPNSIHKLQIKP